MIYHSGYTIIQREAHQYLLIVHIIKVAMDHHQDIQCSIAALHQVFAIDRDDIK
jgi:hypothetical protein